METIIAFILMFGLLVFVHEFGHYIFAKRAGMLVREFAIGFGPKIFSFKWNETLYTIRLLPMGGYVRVAGEDPEIIDIKPGQHIGITFNEDGKVNKIIVNHKSKHPDAMVMEVERIDLDHALTIEGYEIDEEQKQLFHVSEKADFVMDERETQIAPYHRQFAAKSVGQRAMQVFAGPLMNFILAFILFIIVGMIQGIPVDHIELGTVAEDSPAEEAGFQSGDRITAIDDQPVDKWDEFQSMIQEHPNETLEMLVQRDQEEIVVQVTPREVEVPEQENIGQVGVTPVMEKSLLRSIPYSVNETYEMSTLILQTLGKLVTGQFSIDALAGPVGIYDATDQVVQTGMINFIYWTAILSVNLGIMNLLPLPALDGGRLLFVGLEGIRRKPIDPQKEGVVHLIGFALLLLLMIVVTWNDIQRLFL
ncbi:putative membrane-associated zinc metalloprotease [Gracilibacillus halophilus YIM-C55.5]|uniref:Zinc metalloprotease n=1 Tax=Gracilibacillus halophilus YIM-C55.5 TaxID=1308866 RepID=N4WBE0_9BACI|nr:RIP metalloprotease RseP [Gracilibacillus halophilus]ENH96554.1 putative membrane-associated zinc metalloprotease [Gracilibacillus halophilus YIM-C55.5]